VQNGLRSDTFPAMRASASMLDMTLLLLATLSGCMRTPIRLEAEDARLVGVRASSTQPTTQTSRADYSGGGFVTDFDRDGDQIIFTADLPRAGIYDITIRYCSPMLEKGYYLTVNEVKHAGFFLPSGDAFVDQHAGKFELNRGANTIAIEKGWGYYAIDRIELTRSSAPRPPRRPPMTLADASATPEARTLMKRLIRSYGKTTLSGVYSIDDAEFVRATAGPSPAILGGDLMDYSPSRIERGATPQGTVEELIRHARADEYIITLSWHWNAPAGLIDRMITNDKGQPVNARWYKGFNTSATTFDVSKALDDPQSAEYALLLRDIDAIAVELRKLAEARIPVLWRPLHEADGRWFWWGAKGPQPFIKLWRLMFDRLTNHHGLHNLIWVYTGSTKFDWYPGDEYFDVIGVDAYPADTHDEFSGTWYAIQEHFAGKKLLAISEFGGVPDVPRMQRLGVWWSYFVSWTGDNGPRKLAPEALKQIYTSSGVTNRAEEAQVPVEPRVEPSPRRYPAFNSFKSIAPMYPEPAAAPIASRNATSVPQAARLPARAARSSSKRALVPVTATSPRSPPTRAPAGVAVSSAPPTVGARALGPFQSRSLASSAWPIMVPALPSRKSISGIPNPATIAPLSSPVRWPCTADVRAAIHPPRPNERIIVMIPQMVAPIAKWRGLSPRSYADKPTAAPSVPSTASAVRAANVPARIGPHRI
jgi:mannan endo-1,4-beta-mannosidase